jgi:hypothetical protein
MVKIADYSGSTLRNSPPRAPRGGLTSYMLALCAGLSSGWE